MLTQLNTEQLIVKCRHKDQGAQLEIYNRYYKAMYNSALRILKNYAEAEDIMQEAFLTAFTKLSALDDNKMFGAWLKKIVINSSISALRKQQNHNEVSIELVEHSLTDYNEGIEENDVVSLRTSAVLKALKQLKNNYSTVLSLHLIEGYDYEEISEILNISYSNCRTLVSRAKESLRKKIQLI